MSRFKDYMPEMEGKYDITTCPVFEEGQKCSVGIGGTGTVVTNQCENPELAAEWLAWAKCSEEGENLIWNELGFDVCNTALWSDEDFAYDESNTYNTFFRVKPYEVLNELAENYLHNKELSDTERLHVYNNSEQCIRGWHGCR